MAGVALVVHFMCIIYQESLTHEVLDALVHHGT